MKNVIIITALVLILAFAAGYVIREKKKGKKCIGCPHCKACGGKCGNKKHKDAEVFKNGKNNDAR